MMIPYPKPTTRGQARANAIHYAEASVNAQSYHELRETNDRAKVWAAIAETFRDDDQEHRLEKVEYLVQEALTRVGQVRDQVLRPENTSQAGGRVQVTMSGQDEQDKEYTFLSPQEWRTVKELRDGRLVTHTPDYIAGLRADVMSDQDKKDLTSLRTGQFQRAWAAIVERRIREYMNHHFSEATIQGILAIIRGGHPKPAEESTAVVRPTGRMWSTVEVQSVDWDVLRAVVIQCLTNHMGRSEVTIDLDGTERVGELELRFVHETEGSTRVVVTPRTS